MIQLSKKILSIGNTIVNCVEIGGKIVDCSFRCGRALG